jgi:hypothetical protein
MAKRDEAKKKAGKATKPSKPSKPSKAVKTRATQSKAPPKRQKKGKIEVELLICRQAPRFFGKATRRRLSHENCGHET